MDLKNYVNLIGPYDFRVLLRKTNFAPTASLRRHKTASIPVIVKHSSDADRGPKNGSSSSAAFVANMNITFTGNTIEL